MSADFELPEVPLPIVNDIIADDIYPIVWSETTGQFEFTTKDQMFLLIVSRLIEEGIIEDPGGLL